MKKHKLNILAPLSVSMVVITLGAAFGVLSGRGAFIGMLSTSLIALVTAIVGGSRYGVSSPTGPMTAAIAVILLDSSSFEAVEMMNLTLVFAAAILLIFVLMGLHKLIKLIPNLVVSGFVNGIALLIVISQLKTMTTQADWILMLSTFAIAMTLSQLGTTFTHLAYKVISSSFVVIVIVSALAYFGGLPVSYLDIEGIAAVNVQLPPLSQLDLKTLWIIVPLAIELALIALLDTMLTSVIMDKKSRTKTQFPRELTGQSIALFGASLFGGIPGAQSTVPSMMMYQEQGHHRLSKILLAIFCIGFTFVFAGLIQFVPLAVFGGIILKIAYDVADFTSLKNLLNCPREQKFIRFTIIIGTCLSTVLISLNLAVIGFTFLFILWNKIFPKSLQIPDLTGQESEGLSDEV